MIIALVVSVFAGVFVLLWLKLPSWAPEWVVDHSPWADPIVRAVEEHGTTATRRNAALRLAGMGERAVPRLVLVITHEDQGVQEIAAEVFSRLKDDRAIVPMLEQILITEQTDPRYITSAPPAKDLWILPLRHQRPTAVADHLLPHLRPGVEIPYQLLDVAGGIDDPRLVEVLRNLLLQPWNPEKIHFGHLIPQPGMCAAKALAESPCASAIPVLVELFETTDPAIRLSVMCGILLTTDDGGRYRKSDWDVRLKHLILAGVTDPDGKVRQMAAMCFGMQEIDGAEPYLLKLSYAADPNERRAAVFALNLIKPGPEAQRRIITLLKDPDPRVCEQAVSGLTVIDDPASVTGDLLALLSSSSERLRESVCSRLGYKYHRTDPRVFPALLTAMDDPVRNVARRAEQSAWTSASTPEQQTAVEEKSKVLEAKWSTTASP